MDEIEKRLRETADNCVTAYEVWGKSKKNAEARERLQEAVHELRKVAARLEIEVAVSERDEMTQRHIPIPPHRASRRRPEENLPDFITEGAGNGSDDDGNNAGNAAPRPPHSGGGDDRPPRAPGRYQGSRRPPMRRPSEGSGNE
ncbi:MAG: hypothetical protein KBC88_03725 [Alphaproteobacteria bacterium]|jgi:hypothetical protein|nr:hypothetical protein [Alphaproteobacteria bacterium]